MAAYLNKPQRVLDVVGIGKAEVRYLVRDPRNWNAIPSRFFEPLRQLRDDGRVERHDIHRNRTLALPRPHIAKRAWGTEVTVTHGVISPAITKLGRASVREGVCQEV